MFKKILQLVALMMTVLHLWGQPMRAEKDTLKEKTAFKKTVTISGLLQPRYTVSLTPGVDVKGMHFDSASKAVTNSFSVRRARVMVAAKINDHFEALILSNLSEFANNPVTGKVLENAYVRYTRNEHFKIMAGQFRPFIGLEDYTPVDFISSLDFTNGYYEFGRNGWQSFQIGTAVYGEIKKGLRYYAGIHNGNGRNQNTDNDNRKHIYGRVEADLAKGITIGANAGSGGYRKVRGDMLGADIKTVFQLGQRFELRVNAEYKEGTNFVYYDSLKIKPDVHDVRIRNFYVAPVVKYGLNQFGVKSIEVSSRYEYLAQSTGFRLNPCQTLIPMLGFEFEDKYSACLQLGAELTGFRNNLHGTTAYSRNMMVAQLQLRF